MTRPFIGITYSSAELDLFTLWRGMFEGFVETGAVPIAIDTRSAVPKIEQLVTRLDGLVISGGGDISPELYGGNALDPLVHGVNTDRDTNELSAWETARDHGIPVLAICRGAQLLNAALGGTLFADVVRDHGTSILHRRTEEELAAVAHAVSIKPDSTLARWFPGRSEIQVNSQHHQGIRALAPTLRTVATSEDGLVEAFESDTDDLLAVQWHPEILWASESDQFTLLTRFTDRATNNARRRVSSMVSTH